MISLNKTSARHMNKTYSTPTSVYLSGMSICEKADRLPPAPSTTRDIVSILSLSDKINSFKFEMLLLFAYLYRIETRYILKRGELSANTIFELKRVFYWT